MYIIVVFTELFTYLQIFSYTNTRIDCAICCVDKHFAFVNIVVTK